ncbi:alpha/beta fold hydrolase [Brevibacillus choshinensis]|uniref:Alpha/beta hydrolase n=1 Tax=Brevibacillus choshinensis TaxID=54911 RepID=A0ABX7FT19_BRECH|nr:alpha/beta hydrolase [Brevibacillus choshinensis]QRG69379.1 alpha/beta hydrolase [Brevibacillus choshinensis]
MVKQVQLGNGLEIAYREEGSDKKETVVLLHGFCGSSGYWSKILPALSQSYRVLAVDLRGHGGSAAPDEPYTMERFAEDLSLLVDKLELGPIHLFGHSLGGYVTLAFAQKYADKLKSFGLIHSTGYPDDEAAKANRDKGAENIRENGMEPFIKALVPKLFAPGHVSTMPEDVQVAKEIGFATKPTGAIQTLKGMRDRDDRNEVLQNTKLPVLLVAGREDQIIPSEKTFIVNGPNVEQVLLSNSGHMGMLEEPEAMADAIVRFVSKN